MRRHPGRRFTEPGEKDKGHRIFDFSYKKDVVWTSIFLPEQAPDWAYDRRRLWNAVEQKDTRINSQLARSITAALPRELDREAQIDIVERFVMENFVSRGMCADVAIHESMASDGGPQPHAHIMLTLREIDRSGFTSKNRSWNDMKLVNTWRKSWEATTNEVLAANDVEERLSLDSYKAQGIDKEPEIHLGYSAAAQEAAGLQTERGDRLREIKHRNALKEIFGDMVYAAEERLNQQLETYEEIKDQTLTPEELHQQTLDTWFGKTTRSTLAAATTAANQFNQWWERTAEAAREMADRVAASWVDRSGPDYPRNMEPERGPER